MNQITLDYPEQRENVLLLTMVCYGASEWVPVWRLEDILFDLLFEDRQILPSQRDSCKGWVREALTALERDEYIKQDKNQVRPTGTTSNISP